MRQHQTAEFAALTLLSTLERMEQPLPLTINRQVVTYRTQVLPSMNTKKAPKTKGQKMAEKARQLANHATDSERERLLGIAMSLIYRGGKNAACVNRG